MQRTGNVKIAARTEGTQRVRATATGVGLRRQLCILSFSEFFETSVSVQSIPNDFSCQKRVVSGVKLNKIQSIPSNSNVCNNSVILPNHCFLKEFPEETRVKYIIDFFHFS